MTVDLSPLSRAAAMLPGDLSVFVPELLLAAAILVVLASRLLSVLDRLHRIGLALIAVGVALAYASMQASAGTPGRIFTGLLDLDSWAAAFRILILSATLLTLVLARLHGLPDAEDSTDYTVLLLGAALGMMLMASANHLLTLYLAVEMASLPAAALAGFLKGRAKSGEAALKYILYSAAAGGVMLYGISLLAARVGTGDFQSVRHTVLNGGADITFAVPLFFIAVGLGYKLSIVPFHVWLPDAFEAAPEEIGAFLSTASKAAAVALAVRVLGFSADPRAREILLILAALTTSYGNLMAYAQDNLKRLLGYSTIAHAGFLLAAIALCNPAGDAAAIAYLAAYILATFGAFAGIVGVKLMTGQEDRAALAGLMARSPMLAIGFALAILGLLGLPPLAGFAGKFLVLEAVYRGGSPLHWAVFGVLLFNTALAAGYYLNLLKRAILDDGQMEAPAPGQTAAFALLLGLASLTLGLAWSPLIEFARQACSK
jgi:NADH-quinone oxidoreductase subunit N